MSQSCNQCGAEIPPTAPGAICPACLLEQGKSTSVSTEERPAPMLIGDLQTKFPDLEILEFIGSGGMGGVYRARQPQLDRVVALKVVQIGDEPEQHERFLREGKALALLNHPNIVQVYDSGVNHGLGYFVMEYVDGQGLQQILAEEPMPPEEAEDFVLQICEALQYAHDQGITHRDIKPANILIAADGQVKIADFGLAKALQAEPSGFQLTLSQQQVGTPYYMAPEQRVPTASADHRADLYALGVVFYEMLTQRLPIGRVDKPSVHCELDPRVDDLVLAAMDTDPDLRPRSARAMRDRLQEIVRSAHRQRTAKEDPSSKVRVTAPRWQSIRHAAFWTLTSTTLLGLALGGIAMWLFPKQVIAESLLKITNTNLWNSEDTPMNTLRGDAILEKSARELELASRWRMNHDAVIGKLKDQRQISQVPNTDRVRVQFEDLDKDLALAVVNQMANSAMQTEGSLFLGKVTLQINRDLHDWNIFHGSPSGSLPNTSTFTETEIRILKSKACLYQVVSDLELDTRWGLQKPQAYKKLYDTLDVREERGTDLITIEYWDEDPRRAAEVANAIAKSYQQRRMNIESERSQNALDTLQKQLDAQSASVEKARLKMLDLAERYRIIDAGALKSGALATGDSVTGTGTEIILMNGMSATFEAKASLAVIENKLKLLEDLEGEELIQAVITWDTSGSNSTLWSIYHRNKDTLELALENGWGENHPKVRRLREKMNESSHTAIENLKQLLQAERTATEQMLTQPKDLERSAESSTDERRKLAEYS